MALANAILCAYNACGTLVQFVESDFAKTLNVLGDQRGGRIDFRLKEAAESSVNRLPRL